MRCIDVILKELIDHDCYALMARYNNIRFIQVFTDGELFRVDLEIFVGYRLGDNISFWASASPVEDENCVSLQWPHSQCIAYHDLHNLDWLDAIINNYKRTGPFSETY